MDDDAGKAGVGPELDSHRDEGLVGVARVFVDADAVPAGDVTLAHRKVDGSQAGRAREERDAVPVSIRRGLRAAERVARVYDRIGLACRDMRR